jgi:putative flippase GtrA
MERLKMQSTLFTLAKDTFTDLYLKHKLLIRFAIVGCINTGVDFLTFTLLHSLLGLDKSICQIAGYSVGILNSFVMNKLWTFESKGSRFGTISQLLRFVCVNVISLGVSLAGLKLLCDHFGLNVYIAKIIVTIAAQVVNYAGYKLWVFKKSNDIQIE